MSQLFIDDASQIVDLYKRIQRRFRQIAMENPLLSEYTLPQILLIKVLYHHPGITLTELSKHMSLAKSTVSGIVDRMVEKGLINREKPEENRRIVRLTLTESCLEKKEVINSLLEGYARDVLSKATEEEVGRIIEGLMILERLMCEK